jgi:hypothetical protein
METPPGYVRLAAPDTALAGCYLDGVPMISSIETAHHAALVDWVQNWISEPFPGRASSGPVCPFTANAIRTGALLTEIDFIDGSDVRVLTEHLRGVLQRFVVDVLPEIPGGSVLIGYPNVHGENADNLTQAWSNIQLDLGFEDIVNAWFTPSDTYDPDAAWPDGFFVPMTSFVARRLTLLDVHLCKSNGKLFGRYRRLFRDEILNDGLPPHIRNAYNKLSEHWNVPPHSFANDEVLAALPTPSF